MNVDENYVQLFQNASKSFVNRAVLSDITNESEVHRARTQVTIPSTPPSTLLRSDLLETEKCISKNEKFDVCILLDVHEQFLFQKSTDKKLHEEENVLVVNNSRDSNYVYHILMKTYEGEFLIAAYDLKKNQENYQKLLETKKQTYFSKNKVAKLVVNHEFRRTEYFDISAERFENLATSTANLFEGCLKESFYTRSDNGKSAGGVFQHYYLTQREKEIALGRLNNRQNLKRKTDVEEFEKSAEFEVLQKQVAILDDKYVKHWCESALNERIHFYKKSDVRTIFQTFPNLSHPAGSLPIQADFCSFFKKPLDCFVSNWSIISKKIIKIATSKKRDSEIQSLVRNNTPLKGEEHSQTLALVLLPYLFKRTTKLTSKSKSTASWNPQKSEILKSFIVHIQDSQDFLHHLEQANEEILRMHTEHKLTIQPYVVINGPSLADITSAYVIFSDFKYQVASATQAVDLCMQIMEVFNEKYSVISNHVWQFLEKAVYNFEVKVLYSGVVSLIENLGKC